MHEVPPPQPSTVGVPAIAAVIDADNIDVFVGLLADKHTRPHAAVVESNEQPAGCNSCTTRLLICVYDKNFHEIYLQNKALFCKYTKKTTTCYIANYFLLTFNLSVKKIIITVSRIETMYGHTCLLGFKFSFTTFKMTPLFIHLLRLQKILLAKFRIKRLFNGNKGPS